MFRLTPSSLAPGFAAALAAAGAAGLPAAALAQGESFRGEQTAQPEELEIAPTLPDFPLWDFRVGADGYGATDADFDSGPGSVRRTVAGATIGTTITMSPRFQLRLDGRGEYRHYEFSDAAQFDPVNGEPFDSLYRAYVDGLGLFQATDQWQMALGARISSQGESDADVNDTLAARLFAGPIYKVNDDLSFGLGVLVQSRLEDTPIIVPAPLVTYRFQFNPAYSVHLNAFEGIELRYDPSERFGMALEFDWEYNEFRLDDDGFASDGVFREAAVRVGLSAGWRPTPRLDLTAGIGSFVWQEVELLDAGGDELSQDNLTPSAYVSVGLRYRF
jgi:hypothetical protein